MYPFEGDDGMQALWNRLREKLQASYIFAFCGALFFGFLAHFYKLTNWLPNWDSLVFRHDPQQMTSLGRWFLRIAAGISTDYDLPFLNGLLLLCYIGIAAAAICALFEIKSRATAALCGALAATVPIVTSTLCYNYVADAYALAFLLSCLAAYLLTRPKKRAAVCGVLLLTLAVGIYQAYLTVTIALLTVYLLCGLLTAQDDVRASLKKAGKFLLCGVCTMALYYAIQEAAVALLHVTVSDYQGIAFDIKNVQPLLAAKRCVLLFFRHFVNFSNGFNLYSALHVGVFAVLLVGYGIVLFTRVRKVGCRLLALLYAASLPFGCTALYFVNATVDYHTLMRMSYFVLYLLLLFLYDRFRPQKVRAATVQSAVVPVLCAGLLCNFIGIANVSYHKLQIAFEKSFGIAVRIADRIETADGFENATHILTVGQLADSTPYSVDLPPEITGITDGVIIRHDDETVGQSVLADTLRDYADIDLIFVDGEKAGALEATDTVQSMPCWPAVGSVAVIDDTVVVKLSNDLRPAN